MEEIFIKERDRMLGRIVFGHGIGETVPVLEEYAGTASVLNVYVICDIRVSGYADMLESRASDSSRVKICGKYMLEASEEKKIMETVLSMTGWLLAGGADRNALVLAVGGGITTDMAGFAASIYKRGVRFAYIPTTLLSQVDAAIGGKTGVNYDSYKNMLGVIRQPEFTYICPEVLESLPLRDFLSGAAEMVKTFLIEDGGWYGKSVRFLSDLHAAGDKQDFLRRNRPALLELIHEAAHLQVSHINLMGGEVFLHRDWPTLLKELVRLDIAPEFISTKIPLDEIIIGKLRSCNYQGVIQVSLDAVSPTLIGRLTGRDPHYAQAILKSLMLLDESGIGYQIATVLTSLNCRTDVLREMYEYLCQLKHLRDWRLVPVSNSITKPYNRFAVLKPSEVQLREVMGQIRRLTQQSSPFPIILGTDVLEQQFGRTKGGSCQFKGSECSALTSHLFVLPDGKVSICEQLYWNDRFLIGDVSQESLVDVWNSDKAHRLYTLSRKDIQPQSYCSKCDLFESCFRYQNRCWSNIIKAYGADCWDYPDPRCVYAPPMKNSLGYD